MTARVQQKSLIGLLCVAAMALAAWAAPSAQAAGPEWEVTSITTSVPVFHRTETEVITYHVKNIGDTASGEDVKVVDPCQRAHWAKHGWFPLSLRRTRRLHVPGRRRRQGLPRRRIRIPSQVLGQQGRAGPDHQHDDRQQRRRAGNHRH